MTDMENLKGFHKLEESQMQKVNGGSFAMPILSLAKTMYDTALDFCFPSMDLFFRDRLNPFHMF